MKTLLDRQELGAERWVPTPAGSFEGTEQSGGHRRLGGQQGEAVPRRWSRRGGSRREGSRDSGGPVSCGRPMGQAQPTDPRTFTGYTGRSVELAARRPPGKGVCAIMGRKPVSKLWRDKARGCSLPGTWPRRKEGHGP